MSPTEDVYNLIVSSLLMPSFGLTAAFCLFSQALEIEVDLDELANQPKAEERPQQVRITFAGFSGVLLFMCIFSRLSVCASIGTLFFCVDMKKHANVRYPEHTHKQALLFERGCTLRKPREME